MSQNEPQMSVFGTFPEWYYRDILLLGPSDPPKQVYLFAYPKIEHIPIMMSTWNFQTADEVPWPTWRACQKCKKSKTDWSVSQRPP